MLKYVLSLIVKSKLKYLLSVLRYRLPCLDVKGKIKVSPLSNVFHEEIHISEDWMFVRLSRPVLASQSITNLIRPVARQGSSPETRFSFLKHFRIIYPFISNTI